MTDARESTHLPSPAKTPDIALLQRMFQQLLAGRLAGYNRATHMADAILWRLKRLDAPLSILDTDGGRTDEEVQSLLDQTVRKLTIGEERRDFVRLQSGDTAGYSSAIAMANNIRWRLQKVGARLSSLDPARHLFDEDIDRAIRRAVHDLTVCEERKKFNRLLSGDTQGYDSAAAMAAEIRRNMKAAAAPLSRLDPTGRKPNDAIDWHIKKAVKELTAREEQQAFARLQSDDTHNNNGLRQRPGSIRNEMNIASARPDSVGKTDARVKSTVNPSSLSHSS